MEDFEELKRSYNRGEKHHVQVHIGTGTNSRTGDTDERSHHTAGSGETTMYTSTSEQAETGNELEAVDDKRSPHCQLHDTPMCNAVVTFTLRCARQLLLILILLHIHILVLRCEMQLLHLLPLHGFPLASCAFSVMACKNAVLLLLLLLPLLLLVRIVKHAGQTLTL